MVLVINDNRMKFQVWDNITQVCENDKINTILSYYKNFHVLTLKIKYIMKKL